MIKTMISKKGAKVIEQEGEMDEEDGEEVKEEGNT